MVTASRAQMLAMPVAPTRRWVADSSSARWTITSRPATSGSQMAPYPSSSSSAASSWACAAGTASSAPVQIPMGASGSVRCWFHGCHATARGAMVASMRVVVDYDLCESNALCMAAAPEVFEVRDDDFLYVLQENPPEELRAKVEEAVQRCPKQAIKLED